MCLIVAKPKGVKMPKRKRIRDWFESHPDGFGLAFQHNGSVRILKGALTIEEAFEILDKMVYYLGSKSPREVDVIMHFRVATAGVITPANCHPFPITAEQEKLGSLDLLSENALAHNGMITGYGYTTYTYKGGVFGYTEPTGTKTDTQKFIEDYLVALGKHLWLPAVQALIEKCTSSKFAILSNIGIVYIGQFIEENGLKFSNIGYKANPANAPMVAYKPFGVYNQDEVAQWNTCCSCLSETDLLYSIPGDESEVCASCFSRYVGRFPEVEERVYYAYP